MKVLGQRVDALTLAYRVKLAPEFLAKLKERSDVAREHGRAAFEYAPRGGVAAPESLPSRVRWVDRGALSKRVALLWGELRYSRSLKVWQVTNEPYFRLRVDVCAPGGGALRDCPACKGTGFRAGVVPSAAVGLARDERRGFRAEECAACDGEGSEEEPGFTVEIVWYAQTLADWGLDLTLRESAALASMCGDVLETRLRRIDLCADVQGWEILPEDVKRLAKRPRARWAVDDDGEPTAGDVARVRKPAERLDDGAQTYGSGAMHRRRLTGISVGRGGAIMSRIYDKRVELERDERRRELEEERWRRGGWDGASPVARVEFQLRGVALKEFGLIDPDAVLEPVTRLETYVDARGKSRTRNVVVGHRVLTATEPDGTEVQATLVHRLDDIWRTCLNWVRLVVPELSKSGAPKPVTRLVDDPRWALLRTISFVGARIARPIRRYRTRGVASAAQALGVSLSQAARDGRLFELSEDRAAYGDDDARIESKLRALVLSLKVQEADRVVRWLLDRGSGPSGALEHFAIRANAARARFRHGVDELDAESIDTESIGARFVGSEDGRIEDASQAVA